MHRWHNIDCMRLIVTFLFQYFGILVVFIETNIILNIMTRYFGIDLFSN